MSTHSPGPWKAWPVDNRGHVQVTCKFGDVADVVAGAATARLIAAAPELLATVAVLTAAIKWDASRAALLDAADRALSLIARVEGE